MSSIRSNYIYNTVNQVLNIIVQIVSVPYITRILGANSIGIYSYTNSIAAYFVMFTVLGLTNYGNREIARCKDNNIEFNRTFLSIYAMQIACGLIMLAAYVIYVSVFAANYKNIFLIQIIYIISGIIDINWAMSGLEEFKFTSIRNSIISVLNLLLIILFVHNADDLPKYTLIMSLGFILNQIAAWSYIRKRIRIQHVGFSEVKRHIKPNLILFVPIIAVSLYKIMDKIMLGSLVDIIQVGYYESSEKIIRIPTVLISSLGTVMLPRMAAIYAAGKNDQGNLYIRKSIDLAMILSSSLCFGIMAVSKEFVPLYYGPGFETCIYLYLVLLPSCIFLAFSNVIRTQYLIPKSRDLIFIKGVITGAVVNLTLNALLIPKFYAVGAAVATLIAEFAVCIVQAYFVRNEIDIKGLVYRGIPFVIIGIFMFIILYNLDFGLSSILTIIIKCIVGGLIYSALTLMVITLKHNVYSYNVKNIINIFFMRK